MAAHSHECDFREAFFERLIESERVGRVGVAAPSTLEYFLFVASDPGDCFPRGAVAFEVAGECGIDVALLHGPNQQRRNEATVLAHGVHHFVGRSAQQNVFGDAVHFVGFPVTTEEVFVGFWLPGPEPGARSGATGAAFVAVTAIGGAELVFDMEWLIAPHLMVVSDHVVGARNHASCAPGTQSGVDYFLVQLLPLERPTGSLGGSSFGHGHDWHNRRACQRGDYVARMTSPLAVAQAVAVPIGKLGGDFMLQPTTLQFGKDAGIRGGFAVYVGGRGGPLGDCDGDVVASAFGFFAPGLVTTLWNTAVAAIPARQLGNLYAQRCATWGRDRIGAMEQAKLARLAELAGVVVDGANSLGLSLFAAWRSVALPDDAAGRAYQQMHVLRELRGSAHLVGCVAAGLHPRDAVLLHGGPNEAKLFGWGDALTVPVGLDEARVRAEAITDEICAGAFASLAASDADEFVALVAEAHALAL